MVLKFALAKVQGFNQVTGFRGLIKASKGRHQNQEVSTYRSKNNNFLCTISPYPGVLPQSWCVSSPG